MYTKSLFIFRRSLRLADNTGLLEALKQSKHVLSICIFTPEQLAKNKYKSNNCVQFMIESLQALDGELRKKGSRLRYFYGDPAKVVQKICKAKHIEAVFVNRDYTPYAIKRDKSIARVCKAQGIDFCAYEDILLHPIGSIVSAGGTPYQKYTPYLRNAARKHIEKPKQNRYANYASSRDVYPGEYKKDIHSFYTANDEVCVRGGRREGMKILKNIRSFRDYDANRNNLWYQTTRLAAYIKFGCVSIRECYQAFKKINSKELLRQLFWRDFYYNIAFSFPHVFGKPLKERYTRMVWSKRSFRKWKEGMTGFPLVDACMRELVATGCMHNRGRLVTSNFLIKVLGVDWRKGEAFFAQHLIDYDPSVNNGNWQWSASCGADSQPYFRVFNPWIQSKKYDPQAVYIKTWVPELEDVPARDIHTWYKAHEMYAGYPKPMVAYADAKQHVLKIFKALFR